MSVIIRLQNLPWTASALDIRRYFQNLSIPDGGVHIVGGEKGDAFIAFGTDEDARKAMYMDGGRINDTPIKLYLSSKSEMQSVIAQARGGGPATPAGSTDGLPGPGGVQIGGPPVGGGGLGPGFGGQAGGAGGFGGGAGGLDLRNEGRMGGGGFNDNQSMGFLDNQGMSSLGGGSLGERGMSGGSFGEGRGGSGIFGEGRGGSGNFGGEGRGGSGSFDGDGGMMSGSYGDAVGGGVGIGDKRGLGNLGEGRGGMGFGGESRFGETPGFGDDGAGFGADSGRGFGGGGFRGDNRGDNRGGFDVESRGAGFGGEGHGSSDFGDQRGGFMAEGRGGGGVGEFREGLGGLSDSGGLGLGEKRGFGVEGRGSGFGDYRGGTGGDLRGSGGDFRGSGNDFRGSGSDFRSSGNDFRSSVNDFRGSGNDFRGSGNDMRGSGLDLRGSGMDLRGSGSDLRGSGTDFRGSGNDLRGPGAFVESMEVSSVGGAGVGFGEARGASGFGESRGKFSGNDRFRESGVSSWADQERGNFMGGDLGRRDAISPDRAGSFGRAGGIGGDDLGRGGVIGGSRFEDEHRGFGLGRDLPGPQPGLGRDDLGAGFTRTRGVDIPSLMGNKEASSRGEFGSAAFVAGSGSGIGRTDFADRDTGSAWNRPSGGFGRTTLDREGRSPMDLDRRREAFGSRSPPRDIGRRLSPVRDFRGSSSIDMPGIGQFGRGGFDTRALRREPERDNRKRGRGPEVFVHVSNMNISISFKDVRRFFSGCDIPRDGLKLINDRYGKRIGAAFIKFSSEIDCHEALKRDGQYMNEKRVRVHLCSEEEFEEAMDSFVPGFAERQSREEIRRPVSPTSSHKRTRSRSPIARKGHDPNEMCVMLRNVPFSAEKQDVRWFLGKAACSPAGGPFVEKAPDGRPTGVVYLALENKKCYQDALALDRKVLKGRPVNVIPITKSEFDHKTEKYRVGEKEKEKVDKKPEKEEKVVKKEVPVPEVKSDVKETKNGLEGSARPKEKGDASETKFYCVKMNGLPYSATAESVKDFFKGLEVVNRGISMVFNRQGQAAGSAFVEFVSAADCKKAVGKNHEYIGKRYITVVAIAKKDMLEELRLQRQAGGGGGPGAAPGGASSLGMSMGSPQGVRGGMAPGGPRMGDAGGRSSMGDSGPGGRGSMGDGGPGGRGSMGVGGAGGRSSMGEGGPGGRSSLGDGGLGGRGSLGGGGPGGRSSLGEGGPGGRSSIGNEVPGGRSSVGDGSAQGPGGRRSQSGSTQLPAGRGSQGNGNPSSGGRGPQENSTPSSGGRGPQANSNPSPGGRGPQGNSNPSSSGRGPQDNPTPSPGGRGPQGNSNPSSSGRGPQDNTTPTPGGRGPQGNTNPPPDVRGPQSNSTPSPGGRGPQGNSNPPPGARGPQGNSNPPPGGRGPQGNSNPSSGVSRGNQGGTNPASGSRGSHSQSPAGRGNHGGGSSGGLGPVPNRDSSAGQPGSVVSMTNLPFDVRMEDIMKFFEGHRPLQDTVRLRYSKNGKPTGDAISAFGSPQDAARAIRDCNMRFIKGRPVRLSIHQP